MASKRITYTAAFKAKVVLAAQKQDNATSQFAAQFKVRPISRWKAQLLSNAELVFKDGRTKKKWVMPPNADGDAGAGI